MFPYKSKYDPNLYSYASAGKVSHLVSLLPRCPNLRSSDTCAPRLGETISTLGFP